MNQKIRVLGILIFLSIFLGINTSFAGFGDKLKGIATKTTTKYEIIGVVNPICVEKIKMGLKKMSGVYSVLTKEDSNIFKVTHRNDKANPKGILKKANEVGKDAGCLVKMYKEK